MVSIMHLSEVLSEEDLSRIFDILKHPLRREIIRQLSNKPQTYTQILKKLNVKESSFLNYHLRKMESLLIRKSNGKYELNEVGAICSQLVLRVKENVNISRFKNLQQMVMHLRLTMNTLQIVFFRL